MSSTQHPYDIQHVVPNMIIKIRFSMLQLICFKHFYIKITLYFITATTTQVACPVGTIRYTVGAGAVTDCAPCDAGYYCLEGSSTTTGPCIEGFYCPTNLTNPFNNYPPTIGSYGEDQVRFTVHSSQWEKLLK